MGRCLETAIHHRRIGGRQLQQRHFGRAERNRGIGLKVGFNAHPVRHLRHLVGTNFHNELGGNRVQRIGDCGGKRHFAAIFLIVIFRRPVADPDRRIVAHRVGRQAGLESGNINEGLEGGARLALGLGGAVELAFRIVGAADDGTDSTRAIHRHERGLRGTELLAFALQHVVERLLGILLKAEVDGGVDRQILLHVADQTFDLIHHHVGRVVLRTGPEALRLGGRLGHGGLDFVFGDEADIAHGLQHHLRALFRRLRITRWRQTRWRLQEPCQHRRFAKVHITCRLVEVSARGGLDAIGVRTKIDAVQIHREDLVLGVFLLQPDGEQRFLDLAFQCLLRREEQVLGQLLRQGRAALNRAAMQKIGDHSAPEAQRIDAEMGVETPILDGDHRLRDIGRHVLERQSLAARRASIGQNRSIDGDDLQVRRAFGNGPCAGARHARAIIDDDAGHRDAAPDAKHDAPVKNPAEKAGNAAALARLTS